MTRWDPDYMENLQGHMKTAFKFLMYLFKEYEEILRSQERSFVLEKMIEEVIIRTYKTFIIHYHQPHIHWVVNKYMF